MLSFSSLRAVAFLVSFGFVSLCSAQDRIAGIERFIATLYPDVTQHGTILEVRVNTPFSTDRESSLDVSIQRKELSGVGRPQRSFSGSHDFATFRPPTRSDYEQTNEKRSALGYTFVATFEFDKNELVGFSTGTFDGPANLLRERLNANPSWSDGEVTNFLEVSGAKFGPAHRDELLSLVRNSNLRKIFGDFSILSLEFRARDLYQMREVGKDFAMLEWIVTINLANDTKYSLGFEPVSGRLNWLRLLP